MSSYFSALSSSSSSPASQATTPSGYDRTDDKLVEFKRNLKAVPMGTNGSKTTRLTNISNRGRQKGGSNKIRSNEVYSKTYNILAARPLSQMINPNQVYHANLRLVNSSALTTSSIGQTYAGFQFALTNFAQYSQYVTLFDQYKITEIETWLELRQSQATVLTDCGQYVSAVDLDDANTPTSFDQIEAKQNSITSTTFDGHYHKWQPHVAVAVYSGAFTSFSNEPPMWLDVGSPGVQHYGLKIAATATSTPVNLILSVRAKVLFRQAGL